MKLHTFCLIFFILLYQCLIAQKNKCYLYVYENDCNTCIAGLTHLTEVAVGLEPVVVFGNMSEEEAKMGACEVLHLDNFGIPYIISDSLKKIITKTAKTNVSTLAVLDHKGKVLFHCDIKDIQKYKDKINQFASYSFKEHRVVIPKKDMPTNFGHSHIHISDSLLGVKDKLTNLTFYSTNTWTKKYHLNIKDISVADLYKAYYKDTVYLPNYMKEVEFYKQHNIPYLSFSDNFIAKGDSVFILLEMTVPIKTIIVNGETETIIGDINFLCQIDIKSQKRKFYPIYTIKQKDTVQVQSDETFIMLGNELYLSVYPYSKDKSNCFLAKFQKDEEHVSFQEILSLDIPTHLIEYKKKVKDINMTSNQSVINRLIYFSYSNQIYDMNTKKWHLLPFENGEPTYSPENGFSTNHIFFTMSVYRGKIYSIVRNYDNSYYTIVDKNLKLETKVKLPKLDLKSNYQIRKGKIYCINTQNELIELW